MLARVPLCTALPECLITPSYQRLLCVGRRCLASIGFPKSAHSPLGKPLLLLNLHLTFGPHPAVPSCVPLNLPS